MKVEVKKVNNIKRELKIEVSKDRVSQKLEEVYKEIGKVAKIKGFRPGKVPRHVLEASHGKTAQSEMIQKLIPEVYHEALHQEKLAPIDMPEIGDVNYKDGIVTFTATLETKPEIKIKEYKGLKVKRKESKVTDEEINKTLEYFKQGQGGDDKDKKDKKIDDEFAKGLGFPNLEEFKKSLTRQMEMEKDRQNKFDLENQIMEQLLKKTKVDAPETMVKKQMEHRVKDTIERLKAQGMPEEELKKKEDEIRKDLQGAVEKDIQVYLILDKIAELENIHVHQGENLPAKVIEFLLKEAKWEEAK